MKSELKNERNTANIVNEAIASNKYIEQEPKAYESKNTTPSMNERTTQRTTHIMKGRTVDRSEITNESQADK